MRLEAYRNLNTGTWNLRIPGGAVLGFCTELVMDDPHAKVIDCERKRMYTRNRRTVHLVIVGRVVGVNGFKSKDPAGISFTGFDVGSLAQLQRLTYDPWTMDAFQYKDRPGETWTHGELALFLKDMSCWVR